MAFSRPVIIECISGLDAAFSEEFRTALAGLDTGIPVVVELKRATVVDLPGLETIVETIRARREAGAPTYIAAAAPRLRAMLRQCHAPEEWLVIDGGEAARRRIILASAAHPVRTRVARSA
jgi:hypothetical protein